MRAFADIAVGRQLVGTAPHPRHRHARPYAAVLLSGSFEESGERGRYHVRAGDVVLHDAFDAHCDRIGGQACEFLNFHLPADYLPASPVARVRDLDLVVRRARHDAQEALAMLLDGLEPVSPRVDDWPDELAASLWVDPGLPLGAWARARGLSPEALSRAFTRIWGVTPARFRAELRARKAWRRIAWSMTPLADVAAEGGFADQAHMTRDVAALTGLTPGAWRRSNPFKTAAAVRQ